jgi:murein DD-endopeptidase MepM/ murein hydrolase activator NlpD
MEVSQGELSAPPRELDATTIEWEPGLNVELPIKGEDIPGFQRWVNWNDFDFDPKAPMDGHDGHDFAAYIRDDGNVVFGLPSSTKIRAIADGRVHGIGAPSTYGGAIRVEHGADDSGMFSEYVHVVPTVTPGSDVNKGDVTGTLYQDPEGDEGRLVHLHLSLLNGWDKGGSPNQRKVDPSLIDPSIKKPEATPKGSPGFTVDDMPDLRVEVANFKKVKVNNLIS